MCGESRTHSSEGVVEGQPSTTTLLQWQSNWKESPSSKWKQQFLENAATLFESSNKGSQDAAERIAHLEQLVGRLTVELDIYKKAKAWLSEKADLNAQGGKGSPEWLWGYHRCRSLHRAFDHKRPRTALGCLMPVEFSQQNLSYSKARK